MNGVLLTPGWWIFQNGEDYLHKYILNVFWNCFTQNNLKPSCQQATHVLKREKSPTTRKYLVFGRFWVFHVDVYFTETISLYVFFIFSCGFRYLYNEVNSRFPSLPFSLRALEDEKQVRLFFVSSCVMPNPVLDESSIANIAWLCCNWRAIGSLLSSLVYFPF